MLTVIRVAAAADRRGDACVQESVRVPHRQVLRASVTVMNQAAGATGASFADRLLERVEYEVRAQ